MALASEDLEATRGVWEARDHRHLGRLIPPWACGAGTGPPTGPGSHARDR